MAADKTDRSGRFVTAFGKSAGDYAYAKSLSDCDWAWEFLRRNPDYRRDYVASRSRLTKPVILASGIPVWRPRGHQAKAANWGLACFADPTRHALKQPVFWSQRALRNRAEAEAESAGFNTKCQPDLDLSDQHICVAVLDKPLGQTVLVRTQEVAIDLTVTGTNILLVPVRLRLRIDGLASIPDAAKALICLESALSSKRLPSHAGLQKRDRSRLQRALVALDCKLEGGSLRDTAMMMRALRLTRLAWSVTGDETLKKQVWRSRNSGFDLMQGNYRKLL